MGEIQDRADTLANLLRDLGFIGPDRLERGNDVGRGDQVHALLAQGGVGVRFE